MFFSIKPAIGDRRRFRCGGAEWVVAFFAYPVFKVYWPCHLAVKRGCLPQAIADAGKAGGIQVKAAFIMNFINFIEWPENALAADSITIGVIGRDPSEGAIDAAEREKP